jgi:hypothetical protein
MKSWLLAGAIACLVGTVCLADDGDGQFWVVGNHATNRCEIVTSNPIIDGDLWFQDGPYKSMDDAKLARSTISECPQTEEPPQQR